ncbi:MAG: metalloprotease TldD [bacterium]|nr:metalloprotease TldD [bacterium]
MTIIKPEQFFLAQYGMTTGHFEQALGELLGRKVDNGDLYFEYTDRESFRLEEGKFKEATESISQGVGARAQAGEKTGYAFSDEISVEQIKLAASRARYIALETAQGDMVPVRVGPQTHDLYPIALHPIDVSISDKARLLKLVDEECRRYDPRIQNVIIDLNIQDKKVLIVSRDGQLVGDSQPLTSLRITCIAAQGLRRETGFTAFGGRVEFSYYMENDRYKEFAKKSAAQAIFNLSAEEAPAGLMTVVLGPGWPGILLHEAIGHGLEGDFNRKRTSAFSDKLGQRVASPICTVVDDGTIHGRRGSLNMDDEGTPTQRNVLIDRGILVGYMQDKLNARLMGMQPTGNGRRESYAYPPMPRMTNTFMLAGESSPEDIIRSVPNGLYAEEFGGGQVDITSGNFVFSATTAYLIENGRITKPVKGATLIGHGPTALTKISMVGNDLELDAGTGTCGKDGQSVPVGVGIPTVRIDEMTVGGTKTERSAT